ncbi:TPA: hypothetical protein JAX36_005051 [Enterobacter cloacae subsp. cloacae]|jgi:hypothetical protein|uniref:hypothetical protein n=1 Tax=Shewanella TaxID=22 RepID=UPI001A18B045|nr:hypothetical protein [Enterobacter cloacae subsp. cloacae]
MTEFDAAAEVAKLKAQTKAIRKRSYFRRISKLDKYRGELLTMYRAGASGSELLRWLKSKRIDCAHSTLSRYLNKHNG